MQPYPTPHIQATPADFAQTVLMPGDPKRSRLIAEKFLSDAVLVNDVRGVQGYTGTYHGVPVTVMASGMGMPSMGIYSHELYQVFGVENIIRIGSAGAYRADIQTRDLVIAQGACTDSRYASCFRLPGTYAPIADYHLLDTCVKAAEKAGVRYHVGNVVSSDLYYHDADLPAEEQPALLWGKMGVMAVEMEAAALYMNAARAGKRALAICTITDHLLTGENLDAEQRQNSLVEMIEVALETAAALSEEK